MSCLIAIKDSDVLMVPSTIFMDVLACEFKKDFGSTDKVLSSVIK